MNINRLNSSMSIPATLRVFALLLGVVLLAGCAQSPVYDTYTRFTPPAGVDGKQCLQQCHEQLETCRKECAQAYQICAKEVEPEVQAAFRQALDDYEHQRKLYEQQRVDYERDRLFDRGMRGGVYYGPGMYAGPFYTSGFWLTDSIPIRAPIAPKAPSEAQIRTQVTEQHCSQNCGCQSAYEQCFIDCGGEIERFPVCIAHCGDDDPRPPTQEEFRPGLNLPSSSIEQEH